MTTPTRKIDALHALVESRLRLEDQRYTSSRRSLVSLLDSVEHPVSIGEISHALPNLPRSTAYRNLVHLQKAGLVRRISANDDFSRYELAEELTEHHHHLLCVDCGRVLDVEVTQAFEKAVTSTVNELANSYGFLAHDHRLDVIGLCQDCQR